MRELEDLYPPARGGGKYGKPLALTTVKRTHRTLHKALEDARRWRIIETNPASGANSPGSTPRPAVVAAPTCGSGPRVTQTLSRIDGEMRIRPTKSYRPRTIHLDRHTSKVLRIVRREQEDRRELVGPDWSNENDLVFTTGVGTPLIPDRITTHFTTLSTAAPVPRLRLHDLRHTHASLLLQAGVPAHIVADRMGHHDVRVTLRIYAHLFPVMDEEAAAIFGQHVWGHEEHADDPDEASEEP